MIKTILIYALAVAFGAGLAYNDARAQSWTETVTMTDANGNVRTCTITYVNGGRQRYVNCN
jgi:hypothetical protein